jgi:hypothetical protein
LLSAKHPANIPRPPKLSQSGGFYRLRFAPAVSAPPFMRQLSPKAEEDTCIKYSSNTPALIFSEKFNAYRKLVLGSPQQFTPYRALLWYGAKRHFAFGEKTFALRIRVALMNI